MKPSKTTLEKPAIPATQAPRVPAYIGARNAKIEFSDGSWWPSPSWVEYSQDCPACSAVIALPEVPAAHCPYCGQALDVEAAHVCHRDQGEHIRTRAILIAAADLLNQSIERLS